MDNPQPSPLTDPITDPETTLHDLTLRAQHELASQPLPTQRHLTSRTRAIFAHYTERGTSASLRAALTRYFKNTSHNNAYIKDGSRCPLTFSPPLPLHYTPPPPDPKDSRMRDEESRDLVRGLEFRVDRKLAFRPNVIIPKVLFEGVNNVFRIYQFQAEMMLDLLCEKYGEEAIFRVGVRSLFLSRSESLFECTSANAFNLDPETRLFLLQIYERHPDLNIAEQRAISRGANIGIEVVQSFWQHLTRLRTPYLAMRTVIAARELRTQAAYNAQQAHLEDLRRRHDEVQKRQEEKRKREDEVKSMLEEEERRRESDRRRQHEWWRRELERGEVVGRESWQSRQAGAYADAGGGGGEMGDEHGQYAHRQGYDHLSGYQHGHGRGRGHEPGPWS